MAVFEQRKELNRQKRHESARWDDSFGLKLLGYNEKGKNNAWGHILGSVPGLNTGRHAIAKGIASHDTEKVLDDTFDEAVGRDLAGAALGINIAKTIGTGGMSNFGQGMFGKMMGNKGGKNPLGTDLDITNPQAGGVDGEFKDFAMDAVTKIGGDSSKEMQDKLSGLTNDLIKNPYEKGTPEYDSFEKEKANKNQGIGSQLKKGTKGVFGAVTGGTGLVESGVQYAAQTIDSYKAQNEAFEKYAKGTMIDPGAFNYL